MGSFVTEAPAKNLSFVLEGIHRVRFEDRPIPQIKNPHDVLVQVKYTGICGSDIHYWSHGFIGPYVLTSPMVLGHESSGVVTAVGSSVRTLAPGDAVAMEPGVPCRRCFRCKEGKYNLCPDMAFAATPPYDGTLAKYYVLPEDFCYKLPKGMSLEEGALIEPLAVAVHIARQANIRHGDRVVVFGAGPVGLLVCAVAREFGAGKVIAVDIQKPRLEFAREFAATATFESRRVSSEENARNLMEENDLGWGAEVAIDASGAEPSVQTAIHILKTGGTYVQGGMGKENMVFPIMTCCTKELTVKGSFRYGIGDYKLAVELVAAGKVDVKMLISRKVRFEEAEQAFTDIKAGRGIKILIGGSGEMGLEESNRAQIVESNGVMGTQNTEMMVHGGMTDLQDGEIMTDGVKDTQDSEMKADGVIASEDSQMKATENDASVPTQDTQPNPTSSSDPPPPQNIEVQTVKSNMMIGPHDSTVQTSDTDPSKATDASDGVTSTHPNINGPPPGQEQEEIQMQTPAPAPA